MTAIIFYATTDGHTKKIAETIAKEWVGEVTVAPAQSMSEYVNSPSIKTVVIGASIRYGHFNHELIQAIKVNQEWLSGIQSAFYSVNLTARKPGKSDPASSSYIQKFVHKTGWNPDQIAMFAGKLDYPKYGFFDKQMIRFIMSITGGCADGKSTIEYTNWSEVVRFAKTVSSLAQKR